MDEDARAQIADRLTQARRELVPIEPLSQEFPDLSLDDAYAIQVLQLDAALAQGASIAGYKVGLTSAVMQRQLGVTEPDFGYVTDDMVHLSNEPVSTAGYLQPRIEPELVFVLGADLEGPAVSTHTILAAISTVLPGLEIIDSRIRDWRIGLTDTVADNASSAGVVLGLGGTSPQALDLRLVGCNLYRNGELVGTGAGGAVLGSPLSAVVWLARTLLARGVTLRAGQIILSGSVTAAVPIDQGDVVTATFGGLGSVTTSLV